MNDGEVRRAVYDLTIRGGRVPSAGDVAAELGASAEDAAAAFRRLAEQRILVLDGDAIRMAAPFSGVPTPFVVRAGGSSYFANCIWDALGVSPMLKIDSTIETRCPDCDTPMELAVRGDRVTGDGIVHFSIPARQWWADIVYT